MRAKSIFIAASGVTLLVLLVKFFLPYRMPESQSILPPSMPENATATDTQWIDVLLANNLWDQNRGQLAASMNAGTGAPASGVTGSTGAGSGASWQLIGVSLTGREQFAVIKTGVEIKRLKPGNKLPNGAEVVKVLPYGIQTTRLGNNENFYLFGKK